MKNLFLVLSLTIALVFPSKSFAQTPTDRQLQAIENLMSPQRKKVTDILEADKTGQYKTYKVDLDVIAKENDLTRRGELVEKLERDHLIFIRQAYTNAKINNATLKVEVSKILGKIQFSFGEFADIQIDFTSPAAVLPVRFDTELTCPLGAFEHNESSPGAADCVAQGGNCTLDVQGVAEIAGGCRSKVSLGDNVVIPAGTFTKLTIVSKTDISYDGIAVAIAGYGQVNMKYGLRFKAPGIDKVVLTKELLALAPVVWFSRVRGGANNFVSQATFTGNFPQSATVTAQSYLEGFVLSVPAISLTWLRADTDNVDFIRLSGAN